MSPRTEREQKKSKWLQDLSHPQLAGEKNECRRCSGWVKNCLRRTESRPRGFAQYIETASFSLFRPRGLVRTPRVLKHGRLVGSFFPRPRKTDYVWCTKKAAKAVVTVCRDEGFNWKPQRDKKNPLYSKLHKDYFIPGSRVRPICRHARDEVFLKLPEYKLFRQNWKHICSWGKEQTETEFLYFHFVTKTKVCWNSAKLY